MIKEDVVILLNEKIAEQTYQMIVKSEIGKISKPGQFINVQVEGFYLRRPLSIANFDHHTITFVYKVVGEGTSLLSTMTAGQVVSLLGPLGTNFPMAKHDTVVLIGGGLGLAPLLPLAKEYRLQGTIVHVLYGFQNKEQIYFHQEFESLGCEMHPVIQEIHQLNVVEYLQKANLQHHLLYACGPKGMLASIQSLGANGYISMESRMACAIGVCNGCVCKVKNQELTYKICKKGPVFSIGEIDLCQSI